MLGTYTNEKTDDFMTTEGTQANSVVDFTRSWALGKCKNVDNRASVWGSQKQVSLHYYQIELKSTISL